MVPAYHAPLHTLFTMHQVNRSDEVDHTSESTSDRALANVQDTDKSYEPATHSELSACYDPTMLLNYSATQRAIGASKHLQPESTTELFRTPLQQSTVVEKNTSFRDVTG